MADRREYDVFLGHLSSDKIAVDVLARRLREEGLNPLLDTWHLGPGAPWQTAVGEALDKSRTCAVFLGLEGSGPWENAAMRSALETRVRDPNFRVIPVLLPGAIYPEHARLPRFLSHLTWVDFRAGLNDIGALHRLVSDIRGVSPYPPAPPSQEAVCPYRGLEPFYERHAEFFFGREALTQRLVETLRPPDDSTTRESRFLAVLGPSGSGKSSVVRAGLVPWLRKGALPGSGHWPILTLTPGERPLEALAAAVAPLIGRESDRLTTLRRLEKELAARELTLHLVVVRLALKRAAPARRLMLVVDQFEELFTLCRDKDQRAAFVNNLLYASTVAGGQTIVVLALRTDFYDRSALYPGLGDNLAVQQVLIGPMGERELRQAIEEPARRVGLQFEKTLVNRILEHMAEEPGSLPLMQHALLELWNRREDTPLTMDAYREIGGIGKALAQRAESIYAELKEAEQAHVRRILMRLAQLGEGTEDTRHRARMSELLLDPEQAPVVETVLKQLADAHLITIDRDPASGEQLVDVVHEALIKGWPRLRDWLHEDHATLQVHRRLAEAAQEWERNERTESYLYRGVRLAEAQEWAKRHSADLPPLLGEFLVASLSFQEREQAEEEAAQQRELEAAQGLAEEAEVLHEVKEEEVEGAQQRAIDLARSVRRLRFLAVALTVALAAAIITGLWSWRQAGIVAQQQNAAEQQSLVALSQRLATHGLQALERDPELGLLLATEAVSVTYQVDGTYTVEADSALRQALAHPFLRTLRGHTDGVNHAAFSPDGTRIVTASNDGTARLWNLEGRLLATLTGHTDVVHHAAFNPDRRHIVTTSDDGTARLWDMRGQPLATLTGHTGSVLYAAFSPDGRHILTASADDTARLWDIEGRSVVTLTGHSDVVHHAAFNSDREHIVTASADGTARLWDIEGRPVITLTGHTDPVTRAVFSPDGLSIVTASDDGTARLWDIEGRAVVTFTGHTSAVRHVAFSPEGQRILTASWDGTARLWDLEGQPLVTLSGHTARVNQAAFSPDGGYIVTASDDGSAQLWDKDGHAVATLTRHTAPVEHAAFSPDGERIVTTSADGTVRLWNTEGQPPATLTGHTDGILHAVFSPNGGRILTASWDNTARLWDAEGQPLATLSGHGDDVTYASFSPGGQLIVSTSRDKTARVWDIEGHSLATLSGHTNPVYHAAFSPDELRIATGSADGTARLWDTEGRHVVTLNGHEARVNHVAFSPDGQSILTASADDTARLWDRQGKLLAILRGHTGSVNHAAFSPDGQRIVTASWDDTARLWDVEGQHLATLAGHTGSVLHAVFSPDGQRIVTASADNTARLWDWKGQPLATLSGHTDRVTHAAFSPDGQFVVTASNDNTARLWHLEGRLLAILTGHMDWILHAAFSPGGQRIVTASADSTARLHYVDIEEMMTLAQSRVDHTLTPQERLLYLGEPLSTPEPTVAP
jgi:WD40 repeat protein